MATPAERIDNFEIDPLITAEVIQLRPEQLPPATPVQKLAYEGLRRVADRNPIVDPAKRMAEFFGKNSDN